MMFADILLLATTAVGAAAAVIWACRELGGVLEWFADADAEMPVPLSDADVIAAREELLSR